jgi:hypothetical protein
MQHHNKYESCIDACLRCMAACNYCASMCLQEEDVEEMKNCIRNDMECAVLCNVAAQMMSMDSPFAMDVCEICERACRKCAEECSRHDNDHCQECANACNECAEECATMLL